MPHTPAALLEATLQGASHHLRPVCCANEACGREFLFGEWCRDGDAYRCAWCNKLSHPDGSVTAPDPDAQGTRAMRAFEKRVNERFLAYAAAYFGRGAQTTCYAWRRGEVAAHGADDDEIQVAVLVRNVPTEAGGALSGTAATGAAEWNSTHAVSLRLAHGDGTLEVRGASTVFIDRSVAPCRFSGHVTRTFPTSRATLPLAVRDTVTDGACLEDLLRTDAGRTAVLVALGDHVQTAENRLRDVVASVYFGKAGQIATDLRSRVARSIAETSVGPQVVTVADAAPRQPLDVASYLPVERPAAPAASSAALPVATSADVTDAAADEELERQRKKEEKRRRREAEAEAAAAAAAVADGEATAAAAGPSADMTEWTAAQDEEGNTYYYCEALGETVWELPPGGVIVEAGSKKKKSKKSASHHQDPTADAEAGEWTIGSALAIMGLATPAADIEALLADQGIASFSDFGVYCHDADYLVSLGIEDEGDRKRISKWVRKNVPAQ
jgi:hypothetical protein